MNEIEHNLKIYASKRTPHFLDKVELFPVWTRHGKRSFIKEIIWEAAPDEPSAIALEAPLTITEFDAQFLMDQLWDCGFRPSEGSGSAGALAATERHLKDLQRIIFKTDPA